MDGDPIPISALQHWLFCPRQCALIHVERLWEENKFTVEGQLLHKKVDLPGQTRRGDTRILRALPVVSKRLNITGIADFVELKDDHPFPVEYKRGRPKAHRADEVQLCAQAFCLEEMFDTILSEGAIFYGKIHRRKIVEFDEQLRNLTETVIGEAKEAINSGQLPLPVYEERRCNDCSLIAHCHPRRLSNAPSIEKWLLRQVSRAEERGL
jgi:CRISPR-associated exonuclease Cas4